MNTENGSPGAIVLVHRGGVTKVHRAGVANIETDRPWRPIDHMRLASTSKAFNGAVALSLVQRGRLELDDTIGELLPALPPAWASVTPGQLLQRTSGVPSSTDSPSFGAALTADPKRRFTPIELIGYVANEPLKLARGTSYAYSNTDNIVAALMAEAVSGQSYEGLLRSRVYERLDLNSTTKPSGSALPSPFAHGYLFEGGGPPEDVSTIVGMSGVWASGGMQSTPRDLLGFMRGYVRGELFGPAIQRAQRRWRPGGSEPPGPGVNSAGMSLLNGRRAATVSVNLQLNPLEGSPVAYRAMRRAFGRAGCAALAR